MIERRANLLLVDDDDLLRQTLSASFGSLGYRVRSAQDGFSALEVIREEMPDIMLSDLQMPGMSGFELLYVVRRRFPAIRVVAMSGAYSGDAVPQGVAAHAFHPKGTSPHSLFEMIGAMAEGNWTSIVSAAGTPALIWIARNIHDCSGQAYVLIGCPECLRTFPELLSQEDAIHESNCLYCDSFIRYAIVQAANPPLPSPAKPGLERGAGEQRRLSA